MARIKGFVSVSGGAMHGFAIGPRIAEVVKVACGYDLGVLKLQAYAILQMEGSIASDL